MKSTVSGVYKWASSDTVTVQRFIPAELVKGL